MANEKEFPITTSIRNVSVDYTIRQFRVYNPTSNIIYINLRGETPTKDRYDFIAQPNSIFVSPSVTTRIIRIYIESIPSNKTVPSITVYDTSTKPAANESLYNKSTFVALDNFPYTIPGSGITSYNLPQFPVDRFNTVYIMSNGLFSNTNLYPFVIQDLDYGSSRYGAMGWQDIITIAPLSLPRLYRLRVVFPKAYSDNTLAISVVQSADAVQLASVGIPIALQLPAMSNDIDRLFYPVNPPGYIMSLGIISQSGSSFTPNFRLVLRSHFTGLILLDTTINQLLNPDFSFNIKPRIRYHTFVDFIRADLYNNGSDDLFVYLNITQL